MSVTHNIVTRLYNHCYSAYSTKNYECGFELRMIFIHVTILRITKK